MGWQKILTDTNIVEDDLASDSPSVGQVLTASGTGEGAPEWTTVSVADEDVNIANLTARLPQITDSFSIGDSGDVTVTITGALTVTGNLDVNGSTTSINTTNLEVSDSVIILHTGEAGAYAAGAADTAIVFSGTAVGAPDETQIGKLIFDHTGGNKHGSGNDDIGLFKLGTANSIGTDFATDANSLTIATQLPALNCGGIMLDDASGLDYKATGSTVAGQDGLLVWNGTDLYIYDH